ncbi:MAG: hypothetical protein A2X86_21280 [Bdellovibrionales bacterium GWA2_49_15]|nr:MAG: hypothetical protein A2X86_21280 [Bdellovibrionales bacterium GWA2_49_15]HAZ14912.1 hypothetical protein [Bdellovibrionales bacterium]
MKLNIFCLVLLTFSGPALADDSKFSTHLHVKFQSKACTNCHDFFTKKRRGPILIAHKDVTVDMCIGCHDQSVTGFKHEEEWFSRTGLFTSGMTAKQACEAIKNGINAKFKNDALIARDMDKHLFDDPRVLWAIEGATPKSGNLPENKKEVDLVKGGLEEWKKHVNAWIKGGLKCQ